MNKVPENTEEIEEYADRLYQKIDWMDSESNKVLTAVHSRNTNIQKSKDFFHDEIKQLRQEVLDMNKEVVHLVNQIHHLSSEFKRILKNDDFLKFKDKIDNIPFEEFVTAEELK